MQLMGDFDATKAAAGNGTPKSLKNMHLRKRGVGPSKAGTKTTRERTRESTDRRGWGGSQLSLDQNKKKEHMRAEKEVGGSQLSRDQNKKKEHMRAEKKEGGMGPS